jgi:hypothetical protein
VPIEPEMTEEAWDEITDAYARDLLVWNARTIGPPPDDPESRVPLHIRRRYGFASGGCMIWPATTIVLTVFPSLNGVGRKAYSTRGQLFHGRVADRFLGKRSTTPFCDGARVLLAEGIDPDTKLVMRHDGSSADALRSTVGAAAGLTVADDNGHLSRAGDPVRQSRHQARQAPGGSRLKPNLNQCTNYSHEIARHVLSHRTRDRRPTRRMGHDRCDGEPRDVRKAATADGL